MIRHGSDKNIFMISVIAGGKKRLKFVEIMSSRGCRGGGREGKTNTRPIWARRGIGNHQLPPPVPPSSTSLGPDPAPCNTQLPKLGSITDFGNISSAPHLWASLMPNNGLYICNANAWRRVLRKLYILQTRLTYNCAHLRSTKESLTFEYLDISFLYHVSIGCHWLIHEGTGSV